MKTRIILVRHGETDWNVSHRVQGRADIPLNERGLKQASFVADFLQKEKVDAIYTSPLSRAKTTAETIRGNREIPFFIEEGFTEVNLGLWDGHTPEEMDALFPHAYDQWKEDPLQVVPPEGESFQEVQKRAVAALERIVREQEGKTVVIVSHMGCLSTVLLHISKKSLSLLWEKPIVNCGLSEISYDGNRFEILSWGRGDYIPDEYKMKHPFGRVRDEDIKK